jgi:hypothetical protein
VEAVQRVSIWSRVALWLGAVWCVLAILVAVVDYAVVRPLERDAVELIQQGSVAVAVTLIVLAHGICLVQAIVSLIGIRQCLLSQGKIVGLGRAYLGMMLTGLGSAVLVFVGILHVGRIAPMAVAVPAAEIIVAAGFAWWWGLGGKLTSIARTPSEPSDSDVRMDVKPGLPGNER